MTEAPACSATVQVEGVVAGYSATDEILKGVDLVVESGEIVSIIGPNGAGKSTLLKVDRRHPAAAPGTVRLRERAIQGRPPREISALGVAFVPQEQNIFPTMTVRENLEMGGYVDPRGSRREDRRDLRALPASSRSSAGRPRARSPAASARSWPWPWP